MIVERMTPMLVGVSPYQQDAYHMGQKLWSNVLAMMTNHPEEQMDYVILVNLATGERVKVRFDQETVTRTDAKAAIAAAESEVK